jgi:hypothetical protein
MIILLVCREAPFCINHCMCANKPVATSWGIKHSTCRYQSEFTVWLKKNGLNMPLLDIPVHTVMLAA